MRHCLYHLSNSSLSDWSVDRWVWTISELSVLLSFPYEYLIRYITYDMLVKVFTLVALVYVYSVPELLSQKLLYTINSTKLLSFNKNHSYKNFFNNCVNTPKEYLKYIICKHIYILFKLVSFSVAGFDRIWCCTHEKSHRLQHLNFTRHYWTYTGIMLWSDETQN